MQKLFVAKTFPFVSPNCFHKAFQDGHANGHGIASPHLVPVLFYPLWGFVELLLRGFVQMYSCEEKEDRNKARLYLNTMEKIDRSVSCVLRLRPKSVLVRKTGSTLSQSTYGWINASYVKKVSGTSSSGSGSTTTIIKTFSGNTKGTAVNVRNFRLLLVSPQLFFG